MRPSTDRRCRVPGEALPAACGVVSSARKGRWRATASRRATLPLRPATRCSAGGRSSRRHHIEGRLRRSHAAGYGLQCGKEPLRPARGYRGPRRLPYRLPHRAREIPRKSARRRIPHGHWRRILVISPRRASQQLRDSACSKDASVRISTSSPVQSGGLPGPIVLHLNLAIPPEYLPSYWATVNTSSHVSARTSE